MSDSSLDLETAFDAKAWDIKPDAFDATGPNMAPALLDDLLDFFKVFKIEKQIQASPFGPNKMLVFLPPKSARTQAVKTHRAAQLKNIALYHVVQFSDFNTAIDTCNGAATNLATAIRGALLSYTCNIRTASENGKVNDYDFYRGVGQQAREGYPKIELVYPRGYSAPTGSIAVVQLTRVLELPPRFANEKLAGEFAPAAAADEREKNMKIGDYFQDALTSFQKLMERGKYTEARQYAHMNASISRSEIDHHLTWQLKEVEALAKEFGLRAPRYMLFEKTEDAIISPLKIFHELMKNGKYNEALEKALEQKSYFDMYSNEIDLWKENVEFANFVIRQKTSTHTTLGKKLPFEPVAGRKDDDWETKESSRAEMRTLWAEHTKYTALFIAAAIDKSQATTKIADRLLRNQDEIGKFMAEKLIASYREEEIVSEEVAQFGKKLSLLLRAHITAAAKIVGLLPTFVTGGRENKSADFVTLKKSLATLFDPNKGPILEWRANEFGVRSITTRRPKINGPRGDGIDFQIWRWYENAYEIGELMEYSGFVIEPETFVHNGVLSKLYAHLQQTIEEAIAYYIRDYEAWTKTIDIASDHMLEFSDALTDTFWD
jgi:hypothetical protein